MLINESNVHVEVQKGSEPAIVRLYNATVQLAQNRLALAGITGEEARDAAHEIALECIYGDMIRLDNHVPEVGLEILRLEDLPEDILYPGYRDSGEMPYKQVYCNEIDEIVPVDQIQTILRMDINKPEWSIASRNIRRRLGQ